LHGSFADRYGHRESRTIVQRESLDKDTRTELWNVIVILREMLNDTPGGDDPTDDILNAVWAWDFKRPRDERAGNAATWLAIKAAVLRGEWWEVLDLIENLVSYVARYKTRSSDGYLEAIVAGFNNRFEHYLVGYRFINLKITPVDSAAEAESIDAALKDASVVSGARKHLEQAVEHLADRQNPRLSEFDQGVHLSGRVDLPLDNWRKDAQRGAEEAKANGRNDSSRP
jgi:hypothetical protein